MDALIALAGANGLFNLVLMVVGAFAWVSMTTTDGEVLDTFDVAHWRTECDSEDQENVVSRMSESCLIDRIKRYAEVK